MAPNQGAAQPRARLQQHAVVNTRLQRVQHAGSQGLPASQTHLFGRMPPTGQSRRPPAGHRLLLRGGRPAAASGGCAGAARWTSPRWQHPAAAARPACGTRLAPLTRRRCQLPPAAQQQRQHQRRQPPRLPALPPPQLRHPPGLLRRPRLLHLLLLLLPHHCCRCCHLSWWLPGPACPGRQAAQLPTPASAASPSGIDGCTLLGPQDPRR